MTINTIITINFTITKTTIVTVTPISLPFTPTIVYKALVTNLVCHATIVITIVIVIAIIINTFTIIIIIIRQLDSFWAWGSCS